MTAAPSRANASAVPTLTGLRSWGAVLVALVLTAAGAAFDGAASGTPGWGMRIGFLSGVGLAAILVRRGSIFTAMVQPPIILVVVIFLALRLMTSERMTISLIKVVNTFPTMVIGTALALLICVIRIFAQPLRRPRDAPAPHPLHA